MFNLKEIAKEIYNTACEKGWHNPSPTPDEYQELFHEEISEAFRAWRNKLPAFYYVDDKPEGWAVEYVDLFIRILDYMEDIGLNNNELESFSLASWVFAFQMIVGDISSAPAFTAFNKFLRKKLCRVFDMNSKDQSANISEICISYNTLVQISEILAD